MKFPKRKIPRGNSPQEKGRNAPRFECDMQQENETAFGSFISLVGSHVDGYHEFHASNQPLRIWLFFFFLFKNISDHTSIAEKK